MSESAISANQVLPQAYLKRTMEGKIWSFMVKDRIRSVPVKLIA